MFEMIFLTVDTKHVWLIIQRLKGRMLKDQSGFFQMGEGVENSRFSWGGNFWKAKRLPTLQMYTYALKLGLPLTQN